MDKSLLCTEFCDQTDCPHMAVNVCGHVTLLYLTAGISAHGMSVKLASSLWICAASTIGHRKEVFFGIGNEELPYYRSQTKFAKVMFLFLSVSHSVHRGVCSRGCLVLGGAGPGGVCLVETPRTATAAGGTHPTGMHSCCFVVTFYPRFWKWASWNAQFFFLHEMEFNLCYVTFNLCEVRLENIGKFLSFPMFGSIWANLNLVYTRWDSTHTLWNWD